MKKPKVGARPSLVASNLEEIRRYDFSGNTMIRLNKTTKWIGIFSIILCAPTFAQNADVRPENEIKLPVEDLKRGRWEAVSQILRINQFVELTVLGNFNQLRADPPADSNKFDGAYDRTMWLLGRMRVTEARGQLFDILDFQLDPTSITPGLDPTDLQYYPAAYALLEMCDKKAIDDVFREAASPSNELRLRICARLLSGWLGKSLAEAAVQMRLTAEVDRLNKAQLESSNRKKNLEKMKAFFESGKPLLPIPEAKTPHLNKSGSKPNAAKVQPLDFYRESLLREAKSETERETIVDLFRRIEMERQRLSGLTFWQPGGFDPPTGDFQKLLRTLSDKGGPAPVAALLFQTKSEDFVRNTTSVVLLNYARYTAKDLPLLTQVFLFYPVKGERWKVPRMWADPEKMHSYLEDQIERQLKVPAGGEPAGGKPKVPAKVLAMDNPEQWMQETLDLALEREKGKELEPIIRTSQSFLTQ